jgi:hypothetical protein
MRRSAIALLTLVVALGLPSAATAGDHHRDRGVGRDLDGQGSDGRGYVPQAHPDGAFGDDYVGDDQAARRDRRERSRALKDDQGDPDWDGVTTRGELDSGTDPLEEDSDDDGYRDGEEDPDSDGLTSEEEQAAGLDPARADSDEDGTTDDSEGAGRVSSVDGPRAAVESLDEGRDGTARATVDSSTQVLCSRLDERGAASDRKPCGPEALTKGAMIHASQVVDDSAGARFALIEILLPRG